MKYIEKYLAFMALPVKKVPDPCFRGFHGTSNWEETPGRPRTRWRDYISRLAWGRLRIPQNELENVAGEMDVWFSLLGLLPPRSDPGLSG